MKVLAFNSSPRKEKGVSDIVMNLFLEGAEEAGLDDIFEAPNGIPGLETYLPLLLNGVNEGWLSLERLAAASSEKPAMVYGVYPRKGALKIGCDADMVIVDMKRRVKLSDDTLITACGWTPYDGMTVQGWPTVSILRGNVVMEDDQVLSKKGSGGFIPRLDA